MEELKTMRFVKTKKEHKCSKCLELIYPDEICIQSESFYGRFFHEECYKSGESTLYVKETSTVEEASS